MRNIHSQIGVTLMELVVTLAILGVLAAIGTPVLMGNITAARNSQAQNTLNSIYLTQKNFYVDSNYCYYVDASEGDNAIAINQNLFNATSPSSGPIETVAAGNKFKFYILEDTSGGTNPNCSTILIGGNSVKTAAGYTAYAVSDTATFSINQNNFKTGY